MTTVPNVLIGTPAYGGNIHIDYLQTVLSFKDGVPKYYTFEIANIGNESLITRARNTLISVVYNNPQFTHLFFLDADMGIPRESLYKLLLHEKDVIGMPVPLKGYDATNNPVFNVGERLSITETGLLEVSHVGTAVFMLSRKAIIDLCENSDIYDPSGLTRMGSQQTKEMVKNKNYDVFQVGVRNGIYLSEDYFVCYKLQELGYKIYIDPNIRPIKHNGMYVFQA